MFNRKHQKKKSEIANRLHLVMAIVLLLAGITLYRLYDLQFLKYDLYVALASDQHLVSSELEPQRGRIFLQENREFSETEIYPAATNKEFALTYAIPNKIEEDPSAVAEKLYQVFDQASVETEVDHLIAKDPLFSGLNTATSGQPLAPASAAEREEFKKVKRELEIELRKKIILENYISILSKENDPYEPLKAKVDETVLAAFQALNITGLDYVMQTHRYYPEARSGSQILGFVGFNNDKKSGLYGLEGFFDEELAGRFGSIRAERSAQGDLIILNDREYNKPVNGSDLILTINHSIQFTVCAKLSETALRHGADLGSVVVLEPYTGAVLAMCSWPDYDPNEFGSEKNVNVYNNPAIFLDYEPGSIFKVMTMAASINEGKVAPSTTYVDQGYLQVEGWSKPIKNSDYETFGGHGRVDMATVLEKSLNTGAIFAMRQIGAETFARYVKDFGFGEKTGIELETEVTGDITNLKRNNIRPVEAATASFGQGITATPLQLASAFAAIANGGILMQPYLVGEIVSPDGTRKKTQPKQIRRVLSERTSLLVSGMLVNVVDRGHAKKSAVKGYYIGGKTGTAQIADKNRSGYGDRTAHTFVGYGPMEDPKFVMLVRLDDPKDVRFADSSAAPLFGELADFILNYYQVPKER